MTTKVFYPGYSDTEGKKPKTSAHPKPSYSGNSGVTNVYTHQAKNKLTAEKLVKPRG